MPLSQETSKRIKHSNTLEMISSNATDNAELNRDEITFYKPSKYLKMPRQLLLRSLRLHVQCALKKRKEQRFIFTRLTILDQQFCLVKLHFLYETYYKHGQQYQVWPVSTLPCFL